MHGYVSIPQPWHPPSLSGCSQFLPAYLPEEPVGPGHMCTAGGSLEPQVEHFMALFVVRGEPCDMLVFSCIETASGENSYSTLAASISHGCDCVNYAHN